MGSLLTAIQFLTTLAGAFVAIDYVKSFTDVLCKSYFKSSEKINAVFAECKKPLPDRESIDNIKPMLIDNKSTASEIERIKREHEKVTSTIESNKQQFEKSFSENCQVRSLSSISLFIALSGIMLMFTAAIEDKNSIIAHDMAFVMSALMLLYYVIGWCAGEKIKGSKVLGFSDLRHPVYCFFISFVIVIVTLILFLLIPSPKFIEACWWYVMFGSLFLAFANYAIFPIKILWKARKILDDVRNTSKEIQSQSQKIKKDYEKLMVLNDLSKSLSV